MNRMLHTYAEWEDVQKRIPSKEFSEEDSEIKHPINTNEIKQGAPKKLRILFQNADELTSFKINGIERTYIQRENYFSSPFTKKYF